MRNLKLTIRYDGTDFQGWQTQPGFRTVQETIEAAISSITQEPRVRLNCAGRTDSGVHAYGQVANVFLDSRLDCRTLLKAFNAKLPEDVAIISCEEVHQAFCANKDAIAKRYRYVINDGRVSDPFLKRYAWQFQRLLKDEAMNRASKVLIGRHDFRCFETNYPNRMTSIRTIADISVVRKGETVEIEVEADGFLYNMVRAITGTLVQVGRGYWPVEQVKAVLEAMDRSLAGPTAPPQGLFMLFVKY